MGKRREMKEEIKQKIEDGEAETYGEDLHWGEGDLNEKIETEKSYKRTIQKEGIDSGLFQELRDLYRPLREGTTDTGAKKGDSPDNKDQLQEQLDIWWEMSRIIQEFFKEHNVHLNECPTCGYYNFPDRRECKKCDTTIAKNLIRPFVHRTDILELADEDNVLPGSTRMEVIRNFHRLFPEKGEYRTETKNGNLFILDYYQQFALNLANLPEKYWRQLYDAIHNEEVTRVQDRASWRDEHNITKTDGDIRVLRKKINHYTFHKDNDLEPNWSKLTGGMTRNGDWKVGVLLNPFDIEFEGVPENRVKQEQEFIKQKRQEE